MQTAGGPRTAHEPSELTAETGSSEHTAQRADQPPQNNAAVHGPFRQRADTGKVSELVRTSIMNRVIRNWSTRRMMNERFRREVCRFREAGQGLEVQSSQGLDKPIHGRSKA